MELFTVTGEDEITVQSSIRGFLSRVREACKGENSEDTSCSNDDGVSVAIMTDGREAELPTIPENGPVSEDYKIRVKLL